MTGWLRRYWPKVVSGLAIAAVAGVAGVISYTHIYRLTLALRWGVDHDSGPAVQLVPLLQHVVIVAGHKDIVIMEDMASSGAGCPDPFAPSGPVLAIARVQRPYAQDLLDRPARVACAFINQDAPAVQAAVVQAQRLGDLAHDRPLADPVQVSRPPRVASPLLIIVKCSGERQLGQALAAQPGQFLDVRRVLLARNRVDDTTGVESEPELPG